MSIESAKAFLERVKNDEIFRKKVGEEPTSVERIAFVKAQGFDFTKEELDSLQTELDDRDLDQVAGGTWCGHTHEGESEHLPEKEIIPLE